MKSSDPIEPTAVYDATDASTSDRVRSIAGRTFAYGRSVADLLGRTAREGTSQLKQEAQLLKNNPRGRARTYQDRARWAVDRGRVQAKEQLAKSDKAVDWTEDRLGRLIDGAEDRFSGRLSKTFGAARSGVSAGAERARAFIRRDDAEQAGSPEPHGTQSSETSAPTASGAVSAVPPASVDSITSARERGGRRTPPADH